MDLIDRAANAFKNKVPAPGSHAEKAAIDAACTVGFNAPKGAEMPAQFEDIPLLAEWYTIGLRAQVGFCHPVRPGNSGSGR
ncbi:hypothetical protein H8F21_15405 [Pseudomonas sp. P66]|uniref:Uncharacterized protein n=1 Tax=Pseudomonas arcuscaelestis TaxID=2710591 RepID=A0ABS2BZ96_9PSED|nr:hypothetical protein [Pseudomonas arcuscaelestis]MBM5458953.1 hypothetical protein [Pseudomonas arcuscaelestis]